eukprot:UN19317
MDFLYSLQIYCQKYYFQYYQKCHFNFLEHLRKIYMITFDNIFAKNTKNPFADFKIQDFSHVC